MACASSGSDPDRQPRKMASGPPPRPIDRATATGPEADAEAWSAALRRVAASALRDGVHLFAECRWETDQLVSVEVFGNGVGIWDGKRQFALGEREIRELLLAVDAAGFSDMKRIYGGRPAAVPPAETANGAAATRVICRVRIQLAGLDKETVQLANGEQSPALEALAHEILRRCEGPAETGVGAASLREGLEMIARGELAAETLRLLLHRRPDRAAQADGGFLLRVTGRRVTSREFEPGTGYREPRVLSLQPAEASELAAELARADPGDLPVNLFARVYTDFSLEVLNHAVTVQARQFAGMTAATHGARQARFDQLYQLLQRLHERAALEGEPG